MLVHQILRSKNDTTVVTIPPGATVGEAATLLCEHRIGAVVVSADGAVPLGILSERDIVRELARRGGDCLTLSVEAVMTADIVTSEPDGATDDVLIKMTEGRFRHLPVMQEGRMVGLISIGDVVKARLSELSMERDALQGMVMGY